MKESCDVQKTSYVKVYHSTND